MRIWSMILVSVLCLVACAQSRAPQDAEPLTAGAAPGGDLEPFISMFDSDQGSVDRFYSVEWSPTRMDRQELLIRQTQEALNGLDFNGLAQAGRVDWVLLRDHLESEQADLALKRRRLAEMDPLLPFRATIASLEEARWRTAPSDWEADAGRVSEISTMIREVRERIEEGRKADAASEAGADGPLAVGQVLARRAAAATSSLRWSLYTWYSHYDGYVPGFSWWLKKPYEEATSALNDYERFLREDLAGQKGEDADPLVGDPIGEESLLADLRAEHVAYSPEELIQIGEREFAWCEAEMRKASAEMGLGDDWKAALAKVKLSHVPPGEQAAYAASQVQAGIDFMKEHDLITIPPLCEETWRTTMISPDMQKVLPFAAYGEQAIMVAYPTDDMKHDDKLMSMRGNNRHFTRIVAPHEMIPGHHMQGYMARRYRPDRDMFSTPFFGEGWCLYWEMLLWDMDYARGPEDRIGMLFWRMHRCARIIVSLKFHLGQMTPQEMVDYLVDRVGHERWGATSEVRRYIKGDYSPLYQAAYMIGGLQIRALRAEAVDSGRMTEKQFHDAMMRVGSIPIELARAQLLNEAITKESRASWRFADPLQ
jgi:hypothetical protein